jgi:hypothetical protein
MSDMDKFRALRSQLHRRLNHTLTNLMYRDLQGGGNLVGGLCAIAGYYQALSHSFFTRQRTFINHYAALSSACILRNPGPN